MPVAGNFVQNLTQGDVLQRMNRSSRFHLLPLFQKACHVFHRISSFSFLLCASIVLLISSLSHATSQPNIIYIMADDLGYGELGCFGQKQIRTPHIDSIASNGIKLTNYYTSAPVCAPARCSLMTGRHGGHALVRDNFEVKTPEKPFGGQYPLPADLVTIAEICKAKGYATGAFGKWGLGGQGTTGDPLNQGFDRFFGYNCQRHAHNYYPRFLVDDHKELPLEGNDRTATGEQYAPQLIADEMLKFIRQHQEEPFFVYYPTVIPHLALQVPQEYVDSYSFEETPYNGRAYLPHARPKAAYAGMITFMDDQVGRMLALLDELQLTENTLIIFTSDNGPTHLKPQVDVDFFNSAGGLRGLKGRMYEGGIRVPFVAQWPGKIPAGTESDYACVSYDAMATIAEVIDQPIQTQHDGISYLPTLLGKPDKQQQHKALIWDFAGYGGQMAIRQGDWKLMKVNQRRKNPGKWELYNLKDDPAESTNLATKHPEKVNELSELLFSERTDPGIEKFRFGQYSQTAN